MNKCNFVVWEKDLQNQVEETGELPSTGELHTIAEGTQHKSDQPHEFQQPQTEPNYRFALAINNLM